MHEKYPILNPINSQERYLHGICIRLDALVHMMSSFIESYAENNKIPVTNNEINEKPVIEVVNKKVDYDSLTKSEIVDALTEREVEFNKGDLKSDLLSMLKQVDGA